MKSTPQTLPTICMIVAMSDNRVIGQHNQLPWHLPADLKHFKMITTGNPILMGRKTYLAIGKPLPNRRNLILTRDTTFMAAGCEIVHSLEEALQVAHDHQASQLMIIGGAEVYQQYLAKTQTLYLTIIHHHFSGDAYFPALNVNEWQEISREEKAADEKNQYACTFITLERIHYDND